MNYPVKNSNFRCCCRPPDVIAEHVNIVVARLAGLWLAAGVARAGESDMRSTGVHVAGSQFGHGKGYRERPADAGPGRVVSGGDH